MIIKDSKTRESYTQFDFCAALTCLRPKLEKSAKEEGISRDYHMKSLDKGGN